MYSDDYRYSTGEHTLQGQLTNFIHRVYGWMSLALVTTACVAYYVANSSIFEVMMQKKGLAIGAMIVPFILLMIISFGFNRISYTTAAVLFLVYAATMGFGLSSIFVAYTTGSIALTFVVTSSMFGVMALYGYFTKADLSTLGNIAMMGLFGLIIAMLANLYFQSSTTDYIISGFGVLIFTALTAYDMQKIKHLGYQLLEHDEVLSKVTILGAITLYLDFLNLFLYLLRFLGNRRES